MIITFRNLDTDTINKFKTGLATTIFDFNNVKILDNVYCQLLDYAPDTGQYYLSTLEKHLIDRNYLDIIDGSLFIVADQTVSIDFCEDLIAFDFDGIDYLLGYDYIDTLVVDIPLTENGEKYNKEAVDIDELFIIAKNFEKIDNFETFAPAVFNAAFTKNDLKNIYLRNGDYDLDDIKDVELTALYITNLIRQQLRSITSKLENIDGPDDFQLNIYKNLYDYYDDEATFMLYGNFVCCFYNLGEKNLYNKLYTLINTAIYEYIKLYDVEQPSNTPGISMNSIKSDDKITYIKASFKLTTTI